MFKTIKNFNWIILSSFLSISLGILTFFTFINVGPIKLIGNNLQILLLVDSLLLIVFFYLIFKNIYKIFYTIKIKKIGAETSFRYISLFTTFTLLPSILIAIFSLFIFNFGIQKYFDKQVTRAVNNSYDVARVYYDKNKENVKSEIILMSTGINKAVPFYYSNPARFKKIIRLEKIIRKIDDVYLIDSSGNILISDVNLEENFVKPSDDDFNKALDGLPIFISNNLENKTSVILKLENLVDSYLYISKNMDAEILRYLRETEQALNFYYSVENSQTGIKITFAIIYIIIVTLLLFLSIVIAISFATRLTVPIINLISASNNISKGLLDTKVPEIDSDNELQLLNRNFNNMIDRLKKQQDKLIIAERHLAWESVARKLAHEIKNPLTPIQLSIDRLREKYSKKFKNDDSNFESYLQTINRQIKDIEKLVNEFSNFARMPRPIMDKINLFDTLTRSVDFFNMSTNFQINILSKSKKFIINGDDQQLYRVFINLIKNSNEAIIENSNKNADFKGKIEIEIHEINDYILINLKDNGPGISDPKKAMNPYFTTKKKGTGLGLPIVSKIINEHSGDILITNNKDEPGTRVEISFPKFKK